MSGDSGERSEITSWKANRYGGQLLFFFLQYLLPLLRLYSCISHCCYFRCSQIFLSPSRLLVLYLGYQRWQQQRSFATTSHSDIFTYNTAGTELIYALGTIVFFCGKYTALTNLITVGYYLSSVALPGQMFFHVLTCVERYLAVVHPIIYLGLRHSRGVRIRNISIGCVWLLCLGWIGVTALCNPEFPYTLFFIFLVLFLVVVSFCSISVLHVLIHSGHQVTGNREQGDQSKQRAFNTIIAITGVLWMLFLGFIVCLALEKSNVLSYSDGCLVLVTVNVVTLPSSLVLPLLFLHRAGKLVCCHSNNE